MVVTTEISTPIMKQKERFTYKKYTSHYVPRRFYLERKNAIVHVFTVPRPEDRLPRIPENCVELDGRSSGKCCPTYECSTGMVFCPGGGVYNEASMKCECGANPACSNDLVCEPGFEIVTVQKGGFYPTCCPMLTCMSLKVSGEINRSRVNVTVVRGKDTEIVGQQQQYQVKRNEMTAAQQQQLQQQQQQMQKRRKSRSIEIYEEDPCPPGSSLNMLTMACQCDSSKCSTRHALRVTS
uniref:Uncharacterized protein n=1 Tax=Lygus hesperus TaxID=30085 RepID=A0A0A9WNK7_LYGHE